MGESCLLSVPEVVSSMVSIEDFEYLLCGGGNLGPCSSSHATKKIYSVAKRREEYCSSMSIQKPQGKEMPVF